MYVFLEYLLKTKKNESLGHHLEAYTQVEGQVTKISTDLQSMMGKQNKY